MGDCKHIEDVTANKTDIATLKERIKEESEKHEAYRTAVHTRLTQTGNDINVLRHDVSSRFEEEARRVDSVEHTVQNIDKMITEFKTFGKGVTEAINEFKAYIVESNTKRSIWKDAFKYLCQLAALAVTVIGIIKYLGTV